MKALLIVDVQNDFLPGGALPAPDGNGILPVINELTCRFELVVASKDWHPEDTVHFQRWPVHCVRETGGAEFPDGLDKTRIGMTFLKGTGNRDDGYSAFEVTSEDLAGYLKKNGVDELYLCGLTTEYCVKASALDAVGQGLKTFVISDATAGVKANPGDEAEAYREMEEAGIGIITSKDL